ncbi:MAG TPA: hypothetical protein ENJ28_11925 [Gammaproteobacteria bacterium]|nr:hypothetical protein [Gammaproteobacteria bacterium]
MLNKLIKTFISVPFIFLVGTVNVQAAEFGLFSDVTFSDSGPDEANPSFALGALDFYGTAQIDDKTRVFVEYVFENSDDGLVTDLERLWITRTIRDELSIGVGRFHTPLGFWNRTYHHGAILQDTVSRPFFLDFEDGAGAILPVHVVGLMASGDIGMSVGDLHYEAYVANGPSIDTSIAAASDREIQINDGGDPNSAKTLGFRATFTPADLDLSFSAFAMSNLIADTGNGNRDLVTQLISGVDVNYMLGDFDLLAEFYNLSNKDEVGSLGTQSGIAYFAQLGYQVADSFKVTVRHEAISTQEGDDRYFKELGITDASRNIAALRYDLDDTNALKFEVSQTSPKDSSMDDIKAYVLQWSFLVP